MATVIHTALANCKVNIHTYVGNSIIQYLTYQIRFLRDAVLVTTQYNSPRDLITRVQVLQVRRFVELTGSTETQCASDLSYDGKSGHYRLP
jgi:hypothetical protein